MAVTLVEFDKIKNLLGLEQSTIASYPALSVILERLLAAFQEETGRIFELSDYVETAFANTTPIWMVGLRALPIESINSVVITTQAGDIAATDYIITEYGIRLSHKVKNGKITVDYTGGLEEIPAEISAAALYQLAYEYQSKEQIGATSYSTEGGMVNRPELGLLKETKRMLAASIHPLKLS